jgi:hypothetical protein
MLFGLPLAVTAACWPLPLPPAACSWGKLSLRCAHSSCTALASNALAASSAVSNVPRVSFTLVALSMMRAWKRPDDTSSTPRYLLVAMFCAASTSGTGGSC